MQRAFALARSAVLSPAFGFVGESMNGVFDPLAIFLHPRLIELTRNRHSRSEDQSGSGSRPWDRKAIPGRSSVGFIVSDSHRNDRDLEERAELDAAGGHDSARALGAVWGDDQAAVLMLFSVLQDRLEATFGRRASDGMKTEVLGQPSEPIRIAMLADQEGHARSATGHKR